MPIGLCLACFRRSEGVSLSQAAEGRRENEGEAELEGLSYARATLLLAGSDGFLRHDQPNSSRLDLDIRPVRQGLLADGSHSDRQGGDGSDPAEISAVC